jgi:hypothetical protein
MQTVAAGTADRLRRVGTARYKAADRMRHARDRLQLIAEISEQSSGEKPTPTVGRRHLQRDSNVLVKKTAFFLSISSKHSTVHIYVSIASSR